MIGTSRKLRTWLGLLLACLVPLSCLVESDEEIRIFAIEMDKFPMDSGFLVVLLTDTAGNEANTLYTGSVPKEKLLRVRAPMYDGGEAMLVLQEFRHPPDSGVDTLLTAENLLREYRMRIRQGGSTRLLPTEDLPLPSRPFPADSAQDVPGDAELRWTLGATLPPHPRAEIRFGVANPPPLVQNSSAQGDTSLFPAGAGTLLPDQEYFWQIVSIRGSQSTPGPVWRFRTRPSPPARLAYPACDSCHLGRPMRLVPDYAGGGARFHAVSALPAGLELDSLTGVIAGTPSAYPDSAGYVIRAENVSGAADFRWRLALRPRLLEVPWTGMAEPGERLFGLLLGPDGALLDTLWGGVVPPEGLLRREAPGYDGEEARVLLQVFRDTLLVRERWLRIWQNRGLLEWLDDPVLAAPLPISPQDGAAGLDTVVDLVWEPGSDLRPPPLAELRFGLANPPPVADSNLAGPGSARFRVLPDTVYHWQVVNVRAGVRAAGPVRSFRTRLLPPSSLRYPAADSVYYAGMAGVSLQPQYAGGGRVRYSVAPPLPEGFVLDSLNGVLAVRPEAEAGPGEYRIVARNESGSTSATLRFRVKSRLHDLPVPDSLRTGDSLSIHATTPAGAFLESLWDGPAPAASSLSWSRGHDDGSELHLVYRSFRGGTLLREFRYLLLGASVERLPPAVPGAPGGPWPATGALDQDTVLILSWTQDSLPGPAPLWRLRLGHVNPPPLFRDSLRERRMEAPVLLPDTLYRWSVSALRGGIETPGPVWSFRTRPAPPVSLAYPPDSVLHIGAPASLAPAYAGGTRARYRVSPALPAGLVLDSLTGRISGTPTDTAPATAYEVTAANVSGSARAEVRLRVDWRLVKVTLPEEARSGDSAVVRLLDAGGSAVDTLWKGPVPADRRVGSSTPRYDGSQARLSALVFHRGLLIREYAYAIRGPLADAEALPLGGLPVPVNVSPAETTQTADTVLALAWRSGISDPPPLSRVYLGTAFPPPLYADSVRGESLPAVALAPDTRYHWRVETLRGARSALGAATSFRTRPAAPRALAYPAVDTIIPQYRNFSLAPTHQGGRGTFRIEPSSLPQGWAFDPGTGVLSGTALALAPLEEYRVTLANLSGSVTTAFRLGVGERVVEFLLPDTALQCDSLRVVLSDYWNYLAVLHVLWEGPPPRDLRIRQEVPWYHGGEAHIVMQGYRAGEIYWESIRYIDESQGKFESRPLPELIPPMLFRPTETYDSEIPEVKLMWYQGGSQLNPPPRQRVYFGLTNPPPLWKDSVVGPELMVSTTLPDTVYYWRVEAWRKDETISTPVGSFRSYYPGKRTLAYPGADSVYARGAPMRLEPVYTSRPGYTYGFLIDRALPGGVDFDSLTGIISGTPNGPAPALEYRIVNGTEDQTISSTMLRFRVADDGNATVRRVAAWDLEEDRSGQVADSSGRGFHGTHNASAWTDGVRGRAMRFDDTTFAVFQSRGALQVAGFTLSIWVNPDNLENVAALAEYSEPGKLVGVCCHINTRGHGEVFSGAVNCNIRPSDAAPWQDGSVRERNMLATAGGLIRAGAWNHVAYTFNPRTWESVIYVNGQRAASRILGADFTPLTKGRLFLGMRPQDVREWPLDFGFQGSLDHVEIFDGPLDAAAIREMYETLAPR